MSLFTYPHIAISTAGLATEAKQDDAIALLTTIDADTSSIATDSSTTATNTGTIAGDTTSIDIKTPALGAALIASSTPVNIASDQTVPISAVSLPLPTGAATEATLVTIDVDTGVIAGDTTSIDTKIPSQGAAVTASSTPVNIASDQTVPVSAASLPLPSGAATEVTLSSIDTDTTTIAADTTSIDTKTIANIINSGNSSTAILGSGATFTGIGVDVNSYNSVSIQVHSDVDSAVDGISIQFSIDNTNWDDQTEFTLDVSEDNTRRFQFPVTAQFFRFVYTNGGTGQAEFRLQCILHNSDLIASIHKIEETIIGDRSVNLVKAVIAGETTAGGGGFVNVKVNPAGTIAIEGDVTQSTHDNLNANANIQVGDTDVSGGNPVPISVATLPLPTGAATSANQTTANASLSTIAGDTTSLDTKLPSQGTAVIAASTPVNIASDQTVPVSAVSLPLPTGAATAANQTTANSSLSTIEGAVSGTEMQVDIVASIPTGTNTIGAFNLNRLTPVDFFDTPLLDTSSSNIPGSAGSPLQVTASTAAAIQKIQVFDTTGEYFGIYTGSAASEVLVAVVGPGSDQTVEVAIPISTRISLLSLTVTAISSGNVSMNFLG